MIVEISKKKNANGIVEGIPKRNHNKIFKKKKNP